MSRDRAEFDELKEKAQPLVDLIHTKFTPHTIIVIQYDRVNIYSSEMGMPLKGPWDSDAKF